MLRARLIVFVFLLFLIPLIAQSQQESTVSRDAFTLAFNQALIDIGEATALPMTRNPILDVIAQEMAEAAGCSGFFDPINPGREAAERGFATYPNSPNEAIVTDTTVLASVLSGLSPEAYAREQAPEVYENLQRGAGRYFREMGVGIAECDRESNTPYAYIILFGSQPDVLPVVINNGAPSVQSDDDALPTVRLSITEERTRPRNDQPYFGRALQMRIGNVIDGEPQFGEWQTYSEVVPDWQLEVCGTNTVVVELEDDRGNLVASEAQVDVIGCDDDPEVAAVASPTPTLTVTEVDDSTPTPTLTPTPTSTPTPTASTLPNLPPTIGPISDQTIAINQSIPIVLNVNDADDLLSDLTVLAESADSTIVATTMREGLQLDIQGLSVGETTIQISASDPQAATTQITFNVNVVAASPTPTPTNNPPIISPVANTIIILGQTVSYALSVVDPDDDSFSLDILIEDETVVTAGVLDTQLSLTGVRAGQSMVTVTVSDEGGAESSITFIVTVQEPTPTPTPTLTATPPNLPPIFNPSGPVDLFTGEERVITITVTDPDGDSMTVNVVATSGNPAIATVVAESNEMLRLTGVAVGQTSIALTATDGAGATQTVSFLVTVSEAPTPTPVPNQPPEIMSQIGDQELAMNDAISIQILATDPEDGLPDLSVDVSDSRVAAAIIDSERILQITALEPGQTSVTVTATDSTGAQDNLVFSVRVPQRPNEPGGPPNGGGSSGGNNPRSDDRSGCSNTVTNDWNARVDVQMVWNAESFTISFDARRRDARCIWLHGMAFTWGDNERYILTDTPDLQVYRDAFDAETSFSGFPVTTCIQIRAQNDTNPNPIPIGSCSSDNTIVTRNQFASPNEFFWSSSNPTFRLEQPGKPDSDPCPTIAGSCERRWDNSTEFHQYDPVKVSLSYVNADSLLITFETVPGVGTININDLRFAWLDNNERNFFIRDLTWRKNAQPVSVNFANLDASTCLMLTHRDDAQRMSIPQTCTDLFIATPQILLTADLTFWNEAEFLGGFRILRGFDDNYQASCEAGDSNCQVIWLEE